MRCALSNFVILESRSHDVDQLLQANEKDIGRVIQDLEESPQDGRALFEAGSLYLLRFDLMQTNFNALLARQQNGLFDRYRIIVISLTSTLFSSSRSEMVFHQGLGPGFSFDSINTFVDKPKKRPKSAEISALADKVKN